MVRYIVKSCELIPYLRYAVLKSTKFYKQHYVPHAYILLVLGRHTLVSQEIITALTSRNGCSSQVANFYQALHAYLGYLSWMNTYVFGVHG